MAVRTFKVGLSMNSNLRKSLTKKLAQDMYQLMDHIEEHKRVEDDQAQSKGKAKAFTPERRDPRPNHFGPNQSKREFFNICIRTWAPWTN